MRTSHRFHAVLLPMLALAMSMARPAHVPTDAQAASTNQQTWYISAVDRNGHPVEGLGPEAFVITENGVRREVLTVARADEPIDITLLIDNSTAAADAITYMRKAIPTFVTALTPANRIALVGISDRPTILTRGTTDTKTLVRQAEALFSHPASGATLFDAIYEVSQGLRSRDATRAAIVAITTDGTEFTNRYSKDIVEALQRAGASFHWVAVGRFEYTDAELVIRERSFLLNDGPRQSGGALYTMVGPGGIAQSLDKIARDLSTQYKVVYARPQTTIPPDKILVSSNTEDIKMRGTPARAPKGASR